MEVLLYIGIVAIVAVIGMYVIIRIIDYFEYCDFPTYVSTSSIKLTFKQFISFYNLNPNRYHHVSSEWFYPYTYVSLDLPSVYIVFSYKDYRKYKRWLKNKKKESLKDNTRQLTVAYLQSVEKEVQKEEEKALQCINNATTEIQRIATIEAQRILNK